MLGVLQGEVCEQRVDRGEAVVAGRGRVAALSTYLGHASPAETYWYLTATPELMGAAAERLELRFGGRP